MQVDEYSVAMLAIAGCGADVIRGADDAQPDGAPTPSLQSMKVETVRSVGFRIVE